MDAEIRAAVLGRRRPSVEPAVLAGWRRVTVLGAPYPTLAPDRGGAVDGVLVRVDVAALRRLRRYEGPDYRIVELAVQAGARNVTARVFVTGGSLRSPEWSYEHWRRRDKKRALDAIRSHGRAA